MIELIDNLLQGSIIVLLLYIAWYDSQTMQIPNRYLQILLIPVVLTALLHLVDSGRWWDCLAGVFAVSLPMYLLTLLIKDCFGGGDIKLMAVCGGWLGWQDISLAMFMAVIAGGVYGVYLLGKNKEKRFQHFAFGPFLVAGMMIAWLWGEEILIWYIGLF